MGDIQIARFTVTKSTKSRKAVKPKGTRLTYQNMRAAMEVGLYRLLNLPGEKNVVAKFYWIILVIRIATTPETRWYRAVVVTSAKFSMINRGWTPPQSLFTSMHCPLLHARCGICLTLRSNLLFFMHSKIFARAPLQLLHQYLELRQTIQY